MRFQIAGGSERSIYQGLHNNKCPPSKKGASFHFSRGVFRPCDASGSSHSASTKRDAIEEQSQVTEPSVASTEVVEIATQY